MPTTVYLNSHAPKLNKKRTIMNSTAQLFTSLTFFSIALFLLVYTWVPSKDTLQLHEATISTIIPKANTWYEIQIITSDGAPIICKTRRDWPLFGPSRCPLEKIELLIGQKVSILDNGKQVFEMKFGNEMIIDYSAHRKGQKIGFMLSIFMVIMSILVWKYKSKKQTT
jgi:hypothetical protein